MTNPAETIVWQHGDSRVEFALADWPVVIGTGSSADIRIAGPGGQTLAQIDSLQGRLFIQPLLRPSPIAVDEAMLNSNVFLADGQRLNVFGLDILVKFADHEWRLIQDSRGGTFATQPPDLPAADGDDRIVASTWNPNAGTQAAVKQSRNWRAPVAVAVAVLLAAVWWLTTSIAVRLETTPAQPDQLAIEGPGIGIPIAGRWLLRPGVHRIQLRTAGYADLNRDVDIDRSMNTLVLAQEPLPGSLLVVSVGTDATVNLSDANGDQFEENIPARFDGLTPGTYDVSVTAPGYLNWRDQVTIAGRATEQMLSVSLVPDSAQVMVQTEPSGASVFAVSDNALLAETTPATVSLSEGTHALLYQLDGYKPVQRTYVTFANTSVEAAPIVFEPADALLAVATKPSGASVTLDGQYRGRTPVKLALDPDRGYELRVTRPGYASVTRSVRLPAATNEAININLNARIGEVTVRTVPTDASVFVNGRERGKGTVVVELPAEPQSIRVSKPGYVDFNTRVTPRPGYSQTIDARLLTVAQAELAKIDQQITVANDHVMRYFRAGTFKRGTSRREPDRRSNEPLRDVRITKPFYAAVHEVTNRQFAAFRRNHDSRGDVYSSLAGDKNPVVNVSWQDAAAYCNWLSDQEQRTHAYVGEFGTLVPNSEPNDGYRLPTEAEWVWMARYAGREGAPRRFEWGAQMPPPEKSANLADEAAGPLPFVTNIVNGYKDGFPATAPVGSFPANAAGLYDLSGNVAEWVQDYYEISPGIDGPLIDYAGPAKGSEHVIRGGSWRSANVSRLRLAYREAAIEPQDDLGFRVVRNVSISRSTR